MGGSDSLNVWQLASSLTVIQAALLIVGADPATYQDKVLLPNTGDKPKDFDAVFSALREAVLSGEIVASKRYNVRAPEFAIIMAADERLMYAGNRSVVVTQTPDWQRTTLKKDDIVEWLRNRNHHSAFFFGDGVAKEPDYLSRRHPHFSVRLVAAIDAWMFLAKNPERLNNRSPKTALIDFLTKNAQKYSLTNRDGEPSRDGIEEVAKVANWKPSGGAPKTTVSKTIPKVRGKK